ncbi:hypothetical protein RB7475 [Rhodopirellula baltica SH 1]|uniref:Uncharacterized protein n=1 Tax=Rhodopirellula baltica (strain DSM 10527 / NCIMB 13988 / SH1) TaxID=243090 RepID=Q7UNN4_RHOBA|nr:hypothetical protein RB7475 [Rhodopirellula baltica SH 1]
MYSARITCKPAKYLSDPNWFARMPPCKKRPRAVINNSPRPEAHSRSQKWSATDWMQLQRRRSNHC